MIRCPDPEWKFVEEDAMPETWFPEDDEKAWAKMGRSVLKCRNKWAEAMNWPKIQLQPVKKKMGKDLVAKPKIWSPPVVTIGNVSIEFRYVM